MLLNLKAKQIVFSQKFTPDYKTTTCCYLDGKTLELTDFDVFSMRQSIEVQASIKDIVLEDWQMENALKNAIYEKMTESAPFNPDRRETKMEKELQIKIFGHYEETSPLKGSYKEAIYELVGKARLAVESGQADEKWLDEKIEQIAAEATARHSKQVLDFLLTVKL